MLVSPRNPRRRLNMKRTAILVKAMASLAVIAATTSVAWARTGSALNAEAAGLTVNLHVYNYARVDRRALLASEAQAAAILRDAGVSAHWIDCPTSHQAVPNFPGCQATRQENSYIVQLLSIPMVKALGAPADSLGAVDDPGNESRRAGVYFDRVEALAGGATVPVEILLSRVMAREIGSMILGPNAQFHTGIMKAWTANDLTMGGMVQLSFTPAQARQIDSRLAAQQQRNLAEAAHAPAGH